jgi:hypothetical protein
MNIHATPCKAPIVIKPADFTAAGAAINKIAVDA